MTTTATSTVKNSMTERVASALLACGIFSSLLYFAGETAASLGWPAYSYANQAVSELAAIGAPTRSLILAVFSAYNVLVLACAAGVWLVPGQKRGIRMAAVMLAIYAVVGEVTQLFSPMQPRGSQMAATDAGHIVLTAVEVLSIVLFIAFGSGARGKGFRWYSWASIAVIIAAGFLTGAVSTHMTAAASSTPWAGLIERVNIYGTLIWIAAFAAALRTTLREQRQSRALTAGVRGGSPKRVVALVGSGHRGGATYAAARTFLTDLEALGGVEGEIVMLGDYQIGVCRGCKACFELGEEHCLLNDDRDVVLGKLAAADGVVLASPNYAWQVSGLMKVFLDRIAFNLHRPPFQGKVASAIAVHGIALGERVRKYLEFVEGGLGFRVVKGSASRTLEPMTEQARRKMDRSLAEQARRFRDELLKPPFPEPSMLSLAMFRMSRSGIHANAPRDKRDWVFYRDRGWFDSAYYYPTHLGPVKRALGVVADWAGAHMGAFKVARDDSDEGARGAVEAGPRGL